MKRQFWLHPEQVELIVACLTESMARINLDTASINMNSAQRTACNYTARRIKDIVKLLNGVKDA